jgi:transposase
MENKAPVPVVEKVAAMAMKLGARHLADYGAARSRHDFTQRQLMTCLILRAYFKTTYRGMVEILAGSPALRAELGLQEKLPHYTTVQKFGGRSRVLEIAQTLVAQIGQAALRQKPQAVAMDSTGMSTQAASDYYQIRSGKNQRQWAKISVMVLCGSLLPLSLVVSWGPSNDRVQVKQLFEQVPATAAPPRLYADAGYDAEWIHVHCREQWGTESVIKPGPQWRADGGRHGKWRPQMSPEYLKSRQYGRRWAVESFFSALKRTTGQSLRARTKTGLLVEAAIRVVAYTLRR